MQTYFLYFIAFVVLWMSDLGFMIVFDVTPITKFSFCCESKSAGSHELLGTIYKRSKFDLCLLT